MNMWVDGEMEPRITTLRIKDVVARILDAYSLPSFRSEYDVLAHQIGRPWWSLATAVEYLNDVMQSGYGGVIITLEDRHGSLSGIIDGHLKLSALKLLTGQYGTNRKRIDYDVHGRKFAISKCHNEPVMIKAIRGLCIGSQDEADQIVRCHVDELSLTPDERSCLVEALHRTIRNFANAQIVLVEFNAESLQKVGAYLFDTGMSQMIDRVERIAQATSRRRVSKTLEQCRCRTIGISTQYNPIHTPSDNPFILNSRIDKTNHKAFFGLDDIECAVNTVTPETVQVLCFDCDTVSWFVQMLISKLRDCAMRCTNNESRWQFENMSQQLREVFNDLRRRHRRLLRSEPEDESDAIGAVAEVASIISHLQKLMLDSRALLWECPRNEDGPAKSPPPTLSITPIGCFLRAKQTMCGFEFLPGVYVSKHENDEEDSELLAHELTHAYIYSHRKADVSCPWVEEGLAELCGILTRKQHPGPLKLDPPLISSTDVKHGLMFYEFLETVRNMSAVEVQRLFDTYLDPGENMDWLRSLVNPYCDWNR